MAKNAIVRTIVVLELNNVCVAIYSNNLGAYDHLKGLLPASLQFRLMSYSTINRALQESGQHLDIPTPLGIFVIRKCPLYRFHT